MSVLRELQNLEKISHDQLLKVRYALHRFWELKAQERLVIESIVDTGVVDGLSRDLNNIYSRLRTDKCHQIH